MVFKVLYLGQTLLYPCVIFTFITIKFVSSFVYVGSDQAFMISHAEYVVKRLIRPY